MKKISAPESEYSPEEVNLLNILRFYPSILSKNVQKKVYENKLKDVDGFVKSVVNQTSLPPHSLFILITLIEKVQSPAYLKEHAEEIRTAIPLLLKRPFSPADRHNSRSFSFSGSKNLKVLQKSERYFSFEHYILLAIRQVNAMLQRSDHNNIDLSACDENELLANLQNRIGNCYKYFYSELQYTSYPNPDEPTCRNTISKIALSDYRFYPILPAILSLDAIHQVRSNPRKLSKTQLMEFCTDLPKLDTKIASSQVLYRASIQLVKHLQDVLTQELSPIYSPVLLPCKEHQPRSLFRHDFSNYGFSEQSEKKEQYFRRRKKFVLPVCNTEKLTADLVTSYQLNLAQASHLLEHLPLYLLENNYGENTVSEKYGTRVLGVIKTFRALADPEIYYSGYSGKSFDEIFWSIISKSQEKSFFPQKTNEHPDDCKAVRDFILKYFKYVNISKELVLRLIPEFPLYGAKRIYPSYCDQLLDAFCEYGEETYTSLYILKKYLKLDFDDTRSLTSSIKNIWAFMINQFTVRDALNVLTFHLKTLPSHQKKVESIRSHIISYIDSHQISQNIKSEIKSFTQEQMILLYQRFLHTSISVVGHYSIAILLCCQTAESTASNKKTSDI